MVGVEEEIGGSGGPVCERLKGGAAPRAKKPTWRTFGSTTERADRRVSILQLQAHRA
uniref:Uncharacterized protein n=1 Tax=Rhizophora mucronata TaxID=61149 RepID=A0A2P2QQS7_RHIMU